MDADRRAFLGSLLDTPSPSGFEADGQRMWTDYVRGFADEVTADAYGNAVAVHEGSGDGPELALAGHADEIGVVVRDVLDDGFLRLSRVGGSDRTVSKGQHVTVHAADPVAGVIGQTAIHLRDPDDDEYEDVSERFVDVGAETAEEARDLVEVGDPVTFSTTVADLHGTRVSARGTDNRVGTWAAAEGLRRAVGADVDATVYAVSTAQEELGSNGARMAGFDLAPGAAVAVDVAHATDNPDVDRGKRGPVGLGGGPVVGRESANHPAVVDLARTAAEGRGSTTSYRPRAPGRGPTPTRSPPAAAGSLAQRRRAQPLHAHAGRGGRHPGPGRGRRPPRGDGGPRGRVRAVRRRHRRLTQ